MNRVLRFVPLVILVAAAIAVGANRASAGNGATVLRGTFHTNGAFFLNGTVYFTNETCNEQRVQKPDGSASESASCTVDPGTVLPPSAAHWNPGSGWFSDFWFYGVPGFAGNILARDIHGVLTPSGNISLTATYDAP